MGGYGSGRHSSRRKAEHFLSLDVNRLHRDNNLSPGKQGHCLWLLDGTETARIAFQAMERHLILTYKVRRDYGEWEPVTQTLPLTYINCNYGGMRPFFICNGGVHGGNCQRRVGKLYAGGKFFLCRNCTKLAYSSQSEPSYDRMLRRANKLRTALGGEPGVAYSIAPKPKGMWQRTYQRKLSEIDWCEDQADQLFQSKISHRLSPEERKMLFGG